MNRSAHIKLFIIAVLEEVIVYYFLKYSTGNSIQNPMILISATVHSCPGCLNLTSTEKTRQKFRQGFVKPVLSVLTS